MDHEANEAAEEVDHCLEEQLDDMGFEARADLTRRSSLSLDIWAEALFSNRVRCQI